MCEDGPTEDHHPANSQRGNGHGRTITTLAELPPGTLLDEVALAHTFGVTTRTIRRMIDRRQLPPGVKLGVWKVWFSERVLAHLSARAEKAERQNPRHGAKVNNLI